MSGSVTEPSAHRDKFAQPVLSRRRSIRNLPRLQADPDGATSFRISRLTFFKAVDEHAEFDGIRVGSWEMALVARGPVDCAPCHGQSARAQISELSPVGYDYGPGIANQRPPAVLERLMTKESSRNPGRTDGFAIRKTKRPSRTVVLRWLH